MVVAVGMRLVRPADIDLQGRPAESVPTKGGVKCFGQGRIDKGDQKAAMDTLKPIASSDQ